MKTSSYTRPEENFLIETIGNMDIITFYEGIQEIEEDDGRTRYDYDSYRITRPHSAATPDAISANPESWLSAAKEEEESKLPINTNQMEADIAFCKLMLL